MCQHLLSHGFKGSTLTYLHGDHPSASSGQTWAVPSSRPAAPTPSLPTNATAPMVANKFTIGQESSLMKQNSTEITALLNASKQFLIPLRMADGFSERKFEYLCLALRHCIDAWKDRDSVPKLAVNVLVDLYPATVASSYLYQEDVSEKIREKAEIIAELIREAVQTVDSN